MRIITDFPHPSMPDGISKVVRDVGQLFASQGRPTAIVLGPGPLSASSVFPIPVITTNTLCYPVTIFPKTPSEALI